MKKTDAIKAFLNLKTHPFLAQLYNHDMEVQVNVEQGTGIPVDGEYKGKRWVGYTDNVTTWKPFRIPFNANTDAHYTDSDITFDLSLHAGGIGMTGWDWKSRCSKWVAFDFDALLGHSERHSKKLTVEELDAIRATVASIPWVTLLKSTSGRGLHLYVHLDPFVVTSNHNEHAALARAILSMLSGLTGYDFASKVDVCGGNMWVWHRKMVGTDGLTMLKNGVPLAEVPANWKEHLKVITRKAKRVQSAKIEEGKQQTDFDELIDKRTNTALDDDHKRLLKYLEAHGARWWWDSDNHMLVTHTFHLLQAHKTLELVGPYTTLAQGTDAGNDHNCFLFPLRNGAWVVRRYGPRTSESSTWHTDAKGWTKCYLNRVPDLATVSRLFNAVETDKKGFQYNSVEDAIKGLKYLGIDISLPPGILNRKCFILEQPRRDKLLISFASQENDASYATELRGWYEEKKMWKRVFTYFRPSQSNESFETENYDERIRHLVTTDGDDAGWMLKVGDSWRKENLTHIRLVLSGNEIEQKDISPILGECVENGWRLVNKPFQAEYPGNREWNRNTARFRCVPSLELDKLSHPTWSMIANHCGQALNESIQKSEWCQKNGVRTGGQYLTLWMACLIQMPSRPLPYLFFWGEQNSGKSLFHEAFTEFLVMNGHIRASAALSSQSNFNAELESKILCIIEEVDLRKNNSEAYNRIKDLVTGPEILVHVKGMTPYMAPNYTHWIQAGNHRAYCPVFPGDTRITVCQVQQPEKLIPKDTLRKMLEKEAPDFLAHLLNVEIPDSEDRLALPVIGTEDKAQAESDNMDELERFIHEEGLYRRGHCVTVKQFVEKFHESLMPNEISYWTKTRIGRTINLSKYPKGRQVGIADLHYGNLSFDKEAQHQLTPLVCRDGILTSAKPSVESLSAAS